jgi:uncharacterized membrane protein
MDMPTGVWISSAIIAAVSIPLILHKVPPNSFYGFRTPLTLSKPGIWYPVNSFAGWALLIAAAASAAITLIAPAHIAASGWFVIAAVLLPLASAFIACFSRLRRYR